MGQATIDLPAGSAADSKPSKPVTNADDLLAQLAGQEIDRLLAESDTKPAPLTPPTETTMPDVQAKLEERMKAKEQADEAMSASAPTDSSLGVVASADGAKAATAATDEEFAAEVDALFKELNVSPQDAQIDSAPPPPAVASAAEPAVAGLIENATTAEERAALATDETLQPGDVPELRRILDVKQEPEQRIPVYIRLLELVNAPFGACPQAVRDTLGKLAILTFMNSIGLLLYLVIFRH
jgi:hypothetical protein